MSGVEKRCSDCSLAGADWSGFHLAAPVRFDVVLFPLPAHRTGQAQFEHPALGEKVHDFAHGKLTVRALRRTRPNLCRAGSGRSTSRYRLPSVYVWRAGERAHPLYRGEAYSETRILFACAAQISVGTAGGLSSGELIDNPNMDTSPYRSDCTDHFRTAQDRTIDFSDTTGYEWPRQEPH